MQILRSLLLASLCCLLLATHMAQSQAPVVRVIANTSVSSQEISVEQIRRIFSMRQTLWPNNQPITVFVFTTQHETHQAFSTKVLGMFPYQLDRIWNKLVYSGLGEEPIKVQSEHEMLEFVSQRPGAIGYVMGQVDGNAVNIIEVVKE